MKDANCIFCKIANGEIPSATLYEDDQFRVILDLNPAAKGHALVLPKDHYANLFEIPEDVLGKAAGVAKRRDYTGHIRTATRLRDLGKEILNLGE